jgi:hypothetical protein
MVLSIHLGKGRLKRRSFSGDNCDSSVVPTGRDSCGPADTAGSSRDEDGSS